MRFVRTSALALAALCSLMVAPRASAVPIDLELVLAMDVSGSVSASEFNTQIQGYVDAFSNSATHDAIAQVGGIAVTMVLWSGSNETRQVLRWTQLSTAAESNAFATAIAGLARPFSGLTAPGTAINFSAGLFDNNGFEGNRRIIDISGDGTQNSGANTAAARDAAVAAGITVNGLPIGSAFLHDWYSQNVVGGPGSFMQPANSFADFRPALLTKLDREITGTPEPGTLSLLGGALLVVAWGRRRLGKR